MGETDLVFDTVLIFECELRAACRFRCVQRAEWGKHHDDGGASSPMNGSSKPIAGSTIPLVEQEQCDAQGMQQNSAQRLFETQR